MMAEEVRSVPRSGETVALGRDTITFRVVGEQTSGAYSVLEYVAAPGSGSVAHTHRHEDESFYIVEGAITFQIGERQERAGVGQFITIPVGTRHAFVNAEDVPARAVIVLRPAGLEGFFADMAALLVEHPQGIPGEKVGEVIARYDLDFS